MAKDPDDGGTIDIEDAIPRRYAYCRVSTTDQTCDLQIDAMRADGIAAADIHVEQTSGSTAAADRPVFAAVMAQLRPGDILYVWKVDRLGRDAIDAMTTARALRDKGVHLVITTLGADTRTVAGRLVFGLMAQLAEFEKEQMVERINAGIKAAKARGTHCGRAPKLTKAQRAYASTESTAGKTYKEIAVILGVDRATVWRAVNKAA